MILIVAAFVLVGIFAGCAETGVAPRSATAGGEAGGWENSPIGRPEFFPIMVWCQDPALAERYKAIGVNTFIALWEGPTEEQLAALKKAGLYAICAQNEVGLKHRADAAIIGWMHGDEPDNRQADGRAVPLEKILGDYRKMKEADPTRPVCMNLGQGVANDRFPGRALALDEYRAYMAGADIVSYDVYPVVNIKEPGPDGKTVLRPDGADFLWYVAKGVDRLYQWTDYRKPVWNALECTHIGNPDRIATPGQVRSEVWMSLVHGSRGIIWFVHDFRVGHRDPAGVLKDPEMVAAVGAINREIAGLAAVLNSPTVKGRARVESSARDVPIDIMVKEHDGAVYVFAVGMRNGPTVGRFAIEGLPQRAVAEVLGENRKVEIVNGRLVDNFAAYQVHLYKVAK